MCTCRLKCSRCRACKLVGVTSLAHLFRSRTAYWSIELDGTRDVAMRSVLRTDPGHEDDTSPVCYGRVQVVNKSPLFYFIIFNLNS